MKHRNCSNCGSSILQKVFEAGIPAVCPQCSLIYSVAKGVSNSPQIPQEVKNLAGGIAFGLLFLGALHVVDRLLKS